MPTIESTPAVVAEVYQRLRDRVGGFSLYAGPVSPEQARIRQLEKELADAKARFKQAGRAAGLSGIDTTYQADAAMQEIKRLEKELAELKEKTGQ